MRRSLSALVLLLIPGSLLAAGGRTWRVDSVKEFAAGEGVGIRFDADGGIGPGPERTELARVEESLLLSAARIGSGDVFLGTGFAGSAHRLSGGKTTKLATAPGTGLFAMAVAGGDVYAAATPGGRIFRIGTSAEAVGESGLANVWAMAAEADGSLLVAGGSPGKLVRLRRNGGKLTAETLVDSKEQNLRSVAVAPDGTIWCGSDGRGLLYRIRKGGKPEVLADAARGEVVALLPRADGSVLFASSSGEAVTARPLPAVAAPGDKAPQGSVSVTVETSLAAPAAGSSARAGFDLQLLRADGVVESLAARDDEIAYALAAGESGRVLVATGPKGRIWELDGRKLSIVREIPEKSVLALLPAGAGAWLAAGAEGGALHRLGPSRDPKAAYTSQVHAEERRSIWGAYRVMASPGTKARIEFRSGNSPTPDETWSPFAEASLPEGQVPSPPGRYLQWRIAFAGEGFVRSVAVNAIPGNLPPTLDSVTVLEPGVVFFRGSFGSGTPVIEAANPEEHGMFTTVGEARERPELGKRIFRRGYRTVVWKASDPNDDALLAAIRVRRVDEGGRPIGDWIVAAEDLTEAVWSFDSSALPDGFWQFAVRTSDRRGNPPPDAREDEASSLPVAIDSAAPDLRVRATRNGGRIDVRASAVDALSPLLRAEYSVDGGEWVPLRSVDGVVDERAEELAFTAERKDGRAPSTVVLRALDVAYNVSTRVAWPEEPK